MALIEIVVAAAVSAIIVGAVSTSFAVAVHHELTFDKPREQFDTLNAFEDRIRNLLTRAVYTQSDTQTTFFVGDSVGGNADTSDRLLFTVAGFRPNGTALLSDDTDFANRNQSFGTVGGVTEIGLSTTPVGDAGGKEGLFIRKQTPSDDVQDSGGYESLLTDLVSTVTYEFWDGTEWIATWDTATDQRLPEAVRARYVLRDDTDATEHTLVVWLPNSQGSADQTGTTAAPRRPAR